MGNQGVILAVGLGLIGLGLYFILAKKLKSGSSDMVSVEATIVDFKTVLDTSSSEGRGATTTTSTYPVYEYQLNGQTYRTEGSVGITVFSKDKYRIGTREVIRVRASNPRRISTTGAENATAVMGGLLIAFGVLTIFMMLL